MNWGNGRLHKKHDITGTYKKAKLWAGNLFGIGSDCYVLKYSPYCSLPEHTDDVPEGYNHHRINIVLRGHGTFFCDKTILNLFNTIIIFRPDLEKHSMLNGIKERIVVSIGLLTKKKRKKKTFADLRKELES